MKYSASTLLFLFISLLCKADEEKAPVLITASAGVGRVEYEERVSITPVVSDWDSASGFVSLSGVIEYSNVQPYATVSFFSSDTNEEEWRRQGFLVQENDLQLNSGEVRLGVKVPWEKEGSLSLVPRFGALFSIDEYTRDNFFFLVRRATLFKVNQKVTETVRIFGPTAGVSLSFDLSDTLSVILDTEIAWLGYAEAENDGFNVTIDEAEGWEYGAKVTVMKELKREGSALGLCLKINRKEIDGAVLTTEASTLEYPDNTLERMSVEVVWSTRF